MTDCEECGGRIHYLYEKGDKLVCYKCKFGKRQYKKWIKKNLKRMRK